MNNQNSSNDEKEPDFSNKLKKLSIEKLEEIIARSIGDSLGSNFKCRILKIKPSDSCIGESIVELSVAEDFKKPDL